MARTSLVTIFLLALSLALVIQAGAGEPGGQININPSGSDSDPTGSSSAREAGKIYFEPLAPSPSDEISEYSSMEGKAEAPEIRRLGRHRSSDKSVAGGGVILGGLVTAIFAAVFCYIRVTRKRIHGDQVGH